MKYLSKNLSGEQCTELIRRRTDNRDDSHFNDIRMLHVDNIILPDQELKLNNCLARSGFKFKKDKKSQLVDDIKFHLIQLVITDDSHFNMSYYLSEKLGYNYTYLTNIFSEAEGICIKKYIINQKVERVKTMILSNELSLKQISSLMKYKSVSHLTNQFKKMTGMTPSGFRKMISVK